MKIASTAVALLLVAGLQTNVHAQERTKDRPKQESKEVDQQADRNKEKDREKDQSGKTIEKRENDQGKATPATLKGVDRQDRPVHQHGKDQSRPLPGKGSDGQQKDKHKEGKDHKHDQDHNHGKGNDHGKDHDHGDGHDHGKGNAYGKNKEGLEGKAFGQHRAQEARSRQELTTTVNDHDQKIVISRQKIKEATERLEAERKSGKVSADLYRERKERIARAEQGVLDLERRLIEAKRLK